MRRNAVGEFQALSQPLQFTRPVQLHFIPVTAAAQNSRQRDKQNVRKLVQLGALHPPVPQRCKMLKETDHNHFSSKFPLFFTENLDAFALHIAQVIAQLIGFAAPLKNSAVVEA